MFIAALFQIAKKNLEAAKMFFNRWMYKQTMLHLYSEILFSGKKKWAIKPWKGMEEPHVHIAKWWKPIWKHYRLCDS